MFIEWLQEWGLLLIPAIVVVINQGVKLFILWIKKDLTVARITGYGGMPSSHSAFFTSLSTIIGLTQGFQSAVFAVAAVVTATTLRDAVGIRQSLGKFGTAINSLLKNGKTRGHKVEEILGHTGPEVFVGGIVGIILSIGLYYWGF